MASGAPVASEAPVEPLNFTFIKEVYDPPPEGDVVIVGDEEQKQILFCSIFPQIAIQTPRQTTTFNIELFETLCLPGPNGQRFPGHFLNCSVPRLPPYEGPIARIRNTFTLSAEEFAEQECEVASKHVKIIPETNICSGQQVCACKLPVKFFFKNLRLHCRVEHRTPWGRPVQYNWTIIWPWLHGPQAEGISVLLTLRFFGDAE